jgi:hypothetical protein
MTDTAIQPSAGTAGQSAPGNNAAGLLSDIERVLGQRLSRLKDEVVSELDTATTAGASVGGGVGMAALGTILGGLAFVHLAHKATGLPLWLCYAGSSAAACALGAGLMTDGVRQAGEPDVVPAGTGRGPRGAATGNGR